MSLSVISTLINCFLFGVMALTGEYPGVVLAILGIFPLMNIAGLAIAGSGNKKTGALLIGIGSAAFVPIGLIGVFGAKQLYNEDQQFEETWDNNY